MITITRKFEFDAAHRVLGHEGKCANLHGHRYVAEVTIRSSFNPGDLTPNAEQLDDLGRVIDFSVVKEIIGNWINQQWDHNIILHGDDPQYIHLCETEPRAPYSLGSKNPTAENIAHHLYHTANRLFRNRMLLLHVTHVRIWETPNCCADYQEFMDHLGS